VKAHVIVVKITYTFYSTDPAHTGTVTTRPSGPFIEIDHPDGSMTIMGVGQDGHVTIPGEGIVWVSSGIQPKDVWKEMDRRERLFGIAEKLPKDNSEGDPRRKVVTLESRRIRKRR